MKYKDLVSLGIEEVPPCISLDGDFYWARRAQETLIRQIDPFDLSIVVPPETVSDALDKAESFPLMSAKRLVIMREFNKLNDRDKTFLEKYLKNPSPTSVLVFVGSTKGLNGFESVELTVDRNTMIDEVASSARKYGCEIAPDAISLLSDYCEEDMAKIISEVFKLSAYVGSGGRISAQEVKTCVTPTVTYKIYQLGETVAKGDYGVYKMIEQLEVDPTAVLANLTKYYRNVFYAKIFKGDQGELAKYLQLKPYPLTLAGKTAKKYSARALYELLKLFYKLEADVKSGNTNGEEALELAIAEAVEKRIH